MTKEQEIELAISCLHYLTDEDKKKAGKDLGELVKNSYIEEIKNEFPWYDKEWLSSNVKVYVGTLRSDTHMGSFKIERKDILNSETKFRIKSSIMKDQNNCIYELEIKWDIEASSYWLVKDGTGHIRKAFAADIDFVKRYKEPKSPIPNVDNNTIDETISRLKDLSSTAFAIKKLVKDNNCFLKLLDGKIYLQYLNYLVALN